MNNKAPFTPFSQIIGQERAIRYLKQAMAMDRIPHAYLFVGIPGIGKRTTAIALAQTINCTAPVDGEGCGECLSCRQLMSGNFPDLEQVTPQGTAIKIEQIRELNRRFGYKPVSGRYRISIVSRAEMMTEEAANAFLKTLEEPPERNILILTVMEPLDLLPTILSRCQKVPFQPITADLIAHRLRELLGLEEDMALLLTKMSEGSLGRAIHMHAGGFLENRNTHLQRITDLSGLPPEGVLKMATEITRAEKKRGPEGQEKWEGGLLEVLGIWRTWYRDLMLVKAGGSEDLLFNMDFSHKLKNVAKSYSMNDLIESILLLDGAQRDILRSRNADLLMENTLLALKKRAHRDQGEKKG